jgi:hypothetical protein
VAVSVQVSSATADTLEAATLGDTGEVERLLGQDLGLLNARGGGSWTPLVTASNEGHVAVVRLLLDKGADTNEESACCGDTALWFARRGGGRPGGGRFLVGLLLERGAEPLTSNHSGRLHFSRHLLRATSRSCACCSVTQVPRPLPTTAVTTRAGRLATGAVGGS